MLQGLLFLLSPVIIGGSLAAWKGHTDSIEKVKGVEQRRKNAITAELESDAEAARLKTELIKLEFEERRKQSAGSISGKIVKDLPGRPAVEAHASAESTSTTRGQ